MAIDPGTRTARSLPQDKTRAGLSVHEYIVSFSKASSLFSSDRGRRLFRGKLRLSFCVNKLTHDVLNAILYSRLYLLKFNLAY